MKKLFIAIIAVLFCGGLFAQEEFVTPDYDFIKSASNNPQSEYCYSKLAKRFAKADTTLGVAELQAFYYGYAFQPDYFGYPDYKQFDSIRAIMGQDGMPTEKDLKKIVSLSDEMIKECPSEPEAYLFKYEGLSLLAEHYGGDTVEAEKVKWQFQMLFYTIASTGNGLGPDAAMHVVNTGHEYLMMNLYGFRPTSQSLSFIEGHAYDIMEVNSEDYDVDSLYFNIDCIINSWDKLFSEEEEEEELLEPGLPVGTIGTSITIEMGSRVELELVKAKRKNSKFRVAMVTYLPEDTLSSMADTANLSMDVPEGRIVFYLFNVRDAEDSGKVRTCLMYSSNCKADMLYLDTKAHIAGACIMDFQPEENLGMAKGVWKTMMWEYGVDVLVSNIRTKK